MLKHKFSKIISIALVAFTSLSTVAFAQPTDIANHWAKAKIEAMVEDEIIKGYPDGTFKPDNSISRAEFVTMVNGAFAKFDEEAETSFSDIKASDWYYRQVASGDEAGYINGYPDNTFRPNNEITREEAAVVLAKILNKSSDDSDTVDFTDASKISSWSKDSIELLVKEEVLKGYPDNAFKPQNKITRAEAVVAIQGALDVIDDANTDTSSHSSRGGGGSSGGGGTTTPTPTAVISNAVANRVPFIDTFLYSVSGDVTSNVNTVEVTIGEKVFNAILAEGKFTLSVAANGSFSEATVVAKDASGAVLETKKVIMSGEEQQAIITNISALKQSFVVETSYVYSVEGNVPAYVDRVEVLLNGQSYTAELADGKFEWSKALDGSFANVTIKAKAGEVVISEVTATITDTSAPAQTPSEEFTDMVTLKSAFIGTTYLYSVAGKVPAATVEVLIGSQAFTSQVVNGEFKVEKAVDGDYATATIKAFKADGTLVAETTVNF